MSAQEIIRPGRLLRTSSESATTARRSSVILVIPACDEAASIGRVLAKVPPELAADVIVVVGSADDPTARVAAAQEAHVLVQSRPGYGAACSEGARLATALGAEVVVFLDGDYSDPPLELASVLAPVLMGEADLVLGCRELKALSLHTPLGNGLVLAALRVLIGRWKLPNLPSFKAIRADVLEALQMQEMTHGRTVEMVMKAARAGLRSTQVSIKYRPRLAGRSKVSGTVLGSLRAAWTLPT